MKKVNEKVNEKKEEEWLQPLKPSMARAPTLRRQADILKSSYARAGIDYEVYDPRKHK